VVLLDEAGAGDRHVAGTGPHAELHAWLLCGEGGCADEKRTQEHHIQP
jgi:hypothetical protein